MGSTLLVAAFFAVRETDGTCVTPPVLWALDPIGLNYSQFGELTVPLTEAGVMSLIKPVFGGNGVTDKVAAMTPCQVDIRMMTQLSYFTIHATGKALEELEGNESFLHKVEIKMDRRELSQILYNMGIRTSTLFPDLDHLAQEICTHYKGRLSSNTL